METKPQTPDKNYEKRGKTEFPSEIWAFINEYDSYGEYGVCAVDFENAYNEVARLQQQIRNMQEIIDDDTKHKTEKTNEVTRLHELLEKAWSVLDPEEWRIKSPKEYIEEGDEYERNRFWLPVPNRWVGQLVEVRKPKIRTRRPLCPNDAPK